MTPLPTGLRPEEWVIWCYRILLGREPESSAIIRSHVDAGFSPEVLRRRLLASEEFEAGSWLSGPTPVETHEETELRRLKALFTIEGAGRVQGSFVDYLGVRTRCAYLPPEYARYAGEVEGVGGAGAVPLHEAAETIALLTALEEGTGLFTVSELGAGWGPWLVAGAAAARQRGRPCHMIGVEGDKGHLAFMRTHMEDNGFDPDAQRLIGAVVGPTDGFARFPVLPDPSADWGAQADFSGDAAGLAFVEVSAVSIRTVFEGIDRVDLMHVDIQGAEADSIEASMETVDKVVRRAVVGTHGRALEERLMTLFAAHGWVIEHEKPCSFRQVGAAMALVGDGVQVWRNDRIPA